ncbi:hypothetical protein MED01_004235 [Micromonospora sp. MED01]|uniref:hypothetical protein n=1 Tax=Micromonospora alfalfae TaxID=2911212 RepID=UPI001EE7B3C9|nr:hypothetical protein [Micromonospora alfalfae]MCG5460809.1 hypothetical protein [Micromonospora alfalfae]
MSAAIKANNFADLRQKLHDATPAVLKATEAYWAALPGVIAAKHRHLIGEEIEVRQAVRHDIETAHAALVADMAPTTRWEATR